MLGMGGKQGPRVLFCMQSRTKCILLVSVTRRVGNTMILPVARAGAPAVPGDGVCYGVEHLHLQRGPRLLHKLRAAALWLPPCPGESAWAFSEA
jgi:hypothetical protein